MADDTRTSDESANPDAREIPIESLPPEVAALLILIGVAAIPLPGPGIPFILAGGLALWPRTFGPMDKKFRESWPKSHRQVRDVLERFGQDLERRYPAD